MPLFWVPYKDASEAKSRLGSIPDGVSLDFYQDGGRVLPSSLAEVSFLVMPMTRGHAVLDHLKQMPQLRAVQSFAAGYDEYLPFIPPHVTFCSATGVNDPSVAEMTVGLILGSGHSIDQYARNMATPEWKPTFGTALFGKRVMIVGHGRIGQAIENRLQGFEVASIVRVAQHADANGVHAVGELRALLPNADVVVLIVPLTTETRHLIGARELALLPDDALLVNVARGPVVDTDALVAELAKGRIRAALDVTDPEPLPTSHPLWHSPRVLITPHAAGMTEIFFPRMDALLGEQMRRFVSGEKLLNVIEHSH